mgnify:CR=1 FL=1
MKSRLLSRREQADEFTGFFVLAVAAHAYFLVDGDGFAATGEKIVCNQYVLCAEHRPASVLGVD